jgi:SAM-dependent methyltransferase
VKAVQDKLIALEMRKTFRLLLGPWIYQSRLMRHGFEKPKGYPGDHLLLERIYDNRQNSQVGSLKKYFDAYFLGNAYAESVRKRKDKTLELLLARLGKSTVKVAALNLACGSCREIRELMAQNPEYATRLQLTALDQDSDALGFSQQALRSVTPRLAVRFVQEDILNLIRDPKKFVNDLGLQDVVYSIGLADFLPDRVLKNLVKFCMDILRPNGQFILAHKDQERDMQAPLPPEWFCDWHFYERSETTLKNLVHEATPSPITIERDASGRIFFVIVTRPDR